MKSRTMICLFGFLFLVPITSFAQDETPKAELALAYSYIDAHPSIPQITSFNLNGGGVAFVYNVTPMIGIKGDFMAYTGGGGLLRTPIFAGTVNGNLFTYMFGPQVKKHSGKVNPFGQALFGAGHTNTYSQFSNIEAGLFSAPSTSNNAFAMEFGGGLDIKLSEHISVRPVEVNYLYTQFHTTNINNSQNNFKYVAGINIGFGEK